MNWLNRHSFLKGPRACGRSLIPSKDMGGGRVSPTVGIELNDKGRVGFSGCRRCGSVHACPACAAAVWTERRHQTIALIDAATSRGMTVAMLTLTTRHHRRHRLKDLYAALPQGWQAISKNHGFLTAKNDLGVLGFVRRHEVTWGEESGWHPHAHILVFADSTPDQVGAWKRFHEHARDAWITRLKALGLPAPSKARAADLVFFDLQDEADRTTIASYMTSTGPVTEKAKAVRGRAANEVAASPSGKKAKQDNSNVWDLLDLAVDGDERAAKLWHEYELATKGHQPWSVSTKLRKVLLADVTPEEPKERPEIGRLTAEEWFALWRHKETPYGLAQRIEDRYAQLRRRQKTRAEATEECIRLLDQLLGEWGIRDPGRRRRRGANPGPPGVISGVPRTRRRGPAGHGR